MKVSDAVKRKLIGLNIENCQCGRPLYVTDDLVDLYCDNIHCKCNITGRIENNRKYSIPTQKVEELINNYDIQSPYDVFKYVDLNKPKDLVDLVEYGNIYLLSNLAKDLFSGYIDIRVAVTDLNVKNIYNKMKVNKEYCYEVYKQIQKYKDELIKAQELLL